MRYGMQIRAVEEKKVKDRHRGQCYHDAKHGRPLRVAAKKEAHHYFN